MTAYENDDQLHLPSPPGRVPLTHATFALNMQGMTSGKEIVEWVRVALTISNDGMAKQRPVLRVIMALEFKEQFLG